MTDTLLHLTSDYLSKENHLISQEGFQDRLEQFIHDFEEGLTSEDDPKNRSNTLKNIIQSKDRLTILSGPPGSAKTYLAATVMTFFNQELHSKVFGLSLSEQAVERLSEKSKMPAMTLETFFNHPDHIPSQTVVIVDEAGLLTTEMMTDLLQHAQEKQWLKLLLLGDYRQETPENGSQPLMALEKEFPQIWQSLKTGFRQKTALHRDFVTNLYQSEADKALNKLVESDDLLWMDGYDDTIDEAVMAYLKWRSMDDNYEKTGLILTQTEAVAEEANQLIQSRIRTFSKKMIWQQVNNTNALSIRQAQGIAVDQAFLVITQPVTGQMMVSGCSRHRYGLQLIIDKNIYQDLACLSHDANQFDLKKIDQAKLTNG